MSCGENMSNWESSGKKCCIDKQNEICQTNSNKIAFDLIAKRNNSIILSITTRCRLRSQAEPVSYRIMPSRSRRKQANNENLTSNYVDAGGKRCRVETKQMLMGATRPCGVISTTKFCCRSAWQKKTATKRTRWDRRGRKFHEKISRLICCSPKILAHHTKTVLLATKVQVWGCNLHCSADASSLCWFKIIFKSKPGH